jgi:LmbE family N-acetylglucosaminyl deacetylase
MKRLPREGDLIPYAPGFPPGDCWLVLAPHPDDEVFGAGATIALAVRRGVKVRLAFVTDGGAQGDAARRAGEGRAAAGALGLPEPEFWEFADRSLAPRDERLGRAIEAALERWSPDTVFVTSPIDLHPDHRALALGLQRALRRRLMWGWRRRKPGWVAAYEVATPLHPNLLVAADPAWDAKMRAAACYRSQLAFRAYDRVAEALGTLRSLTLDGVTHAEAFRVLSSRRLARASAASWVRDVGPLSGDRSSSASLLPEGCLLAETK